MTRKIVHFTSVHPPYDQRVLLKECVSLHRSGFEVVYIVPHDADEEYQGVRLRAVPKPAGRLERMTRTVWRVYRAALEEKADAYHFHDSELIPVSLLLRARGKRVVYDAHEDLPQTVLNSNWLPGRVKGVVAAGARLAEWIAGRLLSGVVAATPAIAQRFPEDKTAVIQNFPLLTEFGAADGSQYHTKPSVISYAGILSDDRGAVEMIKSLAYVPDSLNARLVLAGRIVAPMTREDLTRLGQWKSVDYRGWVSRQEVAAILDESRVGLVVMHPKKHLMESQPTKLFEYMAAGVPIVASDFPVWRQFIEGARCGILVNPLDPAAIGDALTWLLQHPVQAEEMGQRGRDAIRSHINWEHQAEVLREFYSNMLPPGSGAFGK